MSARRDGVVAIAEIRRVYRVHQNPGGQAARVALSEGVMPPKKGCESLRRIVSGYDPLIPRVAIAK
jgi:hypothetical protein